MKTDTKTLIATMRKVADGHTARDCLDRVAADRLEELERELEQERQDRKQAELDVCRALGERNDARAELAVWNHEVKRLEAELETFDEQAIIWWCEYQDLKAKARQP